MELDYKAMGGRIKALRMNKGFLQVTLAKKLGVSQTHMSNIERGRTGVTLENLVNMAETLECSLDKLVLGKDPAPAPTAADALKGCTLEDLVQAIQILKTVKG